MIDCLRCGLTLQRVPDRDAWCCVNCCHWYPGEILARLRNGRLRPTLAIVDANGRVSALR